MAVPLLIIFSQVLKHGLILELQGDQWLHGLRKRCSCRLVHSLCNHQRGILLRIVNEKDVIGCENKGLQAWGFRKEQT